MATFLPTAERHTFPGRAGSVPRRGDAPSRIVIHTTETNHLPKYKNGGAAPHFTIGVGDPGSLTSEPLGVVRVWQHVSLDRTGSALKHPRGTPETNHMGTHCVQIECVTHIGDQPDHGIVGNKGELPPPLIRALAGLFREIVVAIGDVDINQFPDLWSSTNSFGATAQQRFSDTQWENFNGVCGHQHVPNNAHWDPGAFDIQAFVELINRESSGSGAIPSDGVQPPSADWPLLFEEGDRDDRVLVVRGVLQALGHGDFSAKESYDASVVAAVKRLQAAEGISADGVWGPQTHSRARARLDAELLR